MGQKSKTKVTKRNIKRHKQLKSCQKVNNLSLKSLFEGSAVEMSKEKLKIIGKHDKYDMTCKTTAYNGFVVLMMKLFYSLQRSHNLLIHIKVKEHDLHLI